MLKFSFLGDVQRHMRMSIFLCLLLVLIYHFLEVLGPNLPREAEVLQKPSGIIVSGLVFAGRRDRLSIMYCYLQGNMANQGGWLDEVLWVVNTNDEDNLRYLDEIQAQDPKRNKMLRIPGDKLYTNTYYKAWEYLEYGKYYVKIDDDIVWFDDNTIPQLVSWKISHPDDFVVSANIINNPPLGFLHFHMGALHPYLPEMLKSDDIPESWRPSEHGFWTGPSDTTWTLNLNLPYHGHRWLEVRDEKMLIQTPAYRLRYEVWGDSYASWAIAAQMHYSLLQNIEDNSLDLYKFRSPWIMHGERIRINFMCVYADDILDTNIASWPRDRGDEDMIVLDLPYHLRRRVVIVGDALAAHFQYVDQPALASTDLLARYKLLAEDQACKKR